MMDNWNIWPFDYSFLKPWWFLALLLLPFLYWLLRRKSKNNVFSIRSTRTTEELSSYSIEWVSTVRTVLLSFKLLVYVLIVTALAGPFSWKNTEKQEDYKNGIDIILAMDVSLSMFAKDFEPNRLEASKKVAKEFVMNRKADRIGLVVYAGEAYTACPSTLDYNILLQQIDRISGEYIDGGTAIGVGLGTAVTRLRNDSLSTKVIILLTDGSNNAGDLSPEVAAELARAKNIRVYTIGVGSNGEAPSPVITPFGIRFENIPVVIDEETLENIANKTGGKYFRATNEEKLSDIYKEIETIETKKFLDNVFEGDPPTDPSPFILWALLIIVLVFSTEKLIFPHVE
jgi:Ca-activated chloride channel family protein